MRYNPGPLGLNNSTAGYIFIMTSQIQLISGFIHFLRGLCCSCSYTTIITTSHFKYFFRCPFGLAFDEATLRCDWPWLVPACDNTGPIIGSQPVLPSRAEFAKSFNPLGGAGGAGGGGGTNSPFPSVPSIPSFESSRTGRPNLGGQRAGKAFDSNVARDSCENCFSNVLTITGAGRVNDNGLEVASPHSSGSFGRAGQRLRKPKAETFSSTANPLSSPAAPHNPSTSGIVPPAPPPPAKTLIINIIRL